MKKVFLIKRHPMGRKFLAICLFGFIFTVRPLSKTELNHELIHVVQQKELLYLPFFLWYFLEWLVMEAYRHIRFEEEAYRHQDDLDYLKHRKLFAYCRTSSDEA